MGNSILDAFNAAASFSQQMMGYRTGKLREKHNQQLNLGNEKIQGRVQDYLRDNPFIGGADEEEDKILFAKYQEDLNAFIKTECDTVGITNNSKYFQDNWNQIKERTLIAAHNTALGAQDAWRADEYHERLRSDNRRINTEIENYRRDHPFIGGADKEEDEELFKIHLEKENDFINELYSSAGSGYHSDYFKHLLERMQRQSLEDNRNIALGNQDKWRADQDETDYRNALEIIKNNYANFLRDTPYIIGENEEDDQYTQDEYFGKSTYFFDEQIDIAKKKNNSPRFHQMMDQVRPQLIEAARNNGMALHDEKRIERAYKIAEKNISSFLSSGWEPERIIADIHNSINMLGREAGLLPQEMSEMRKTYETEVYKRFAAEMIGQVKDVNHLQAAMQGIRNRFNFLPADIINSYDENGKITSTEERAWSFEGKEEWESELLYQETARIQGEHYKVFDTMESTMQRLLTSGRLEDAIELAKEWSPIWERYYNPKNPEFANTNEDYLRKGDGFFDYRKLEGYLSQGEEGKWVSLLDAYNLEMFLRPQIQRGSNGTVIVGYNEDGSPITMPYNSLQGAFEGFIFYKREAFFRDKRKDGIEDYVSLQLWQAEEARWFENFYSEVGTALKQIDPTLSYDYDRFTKFDTYLKEDSSYYNRDIRKLSDFERDQYAQRCVDLYRSIFFNGITDVPIIRQIMRDFTGSEILSYLTWNNTRTEEGDLLRQMKAFSDKARSNEAEHILFKMHSPERLNISGQATEPTYYFRPGGNLEKAVNDFVEEERKRMADILGLSIDNLKPQWMSSKIITGDVIPKAKFVIENGEHAGTYYLDYDNNANVLIKREDDSVYRRYERQLTNTEQRQQNQAVYQSNIDSISEGLNPVTGEAFDYALRPPPNLQVTQSNWNRTGNGIRNDLTWANYFRDLMNDPETVINQALDKGKNPLTGEDLNNMMPPAFTGGQGAWQRLGADNQRRELVRYFESQLRR